MTDKEEMLDQLETLLESARALLRPAPNWEMLLEPGCRMVALRAGRSFDRDEFRQVVAQPGIQRALKDGTEDVYSFLTFWFSTDRTKLVWP